jgi:CHAD domain-containing protein
VHAARKRFKRLRGLYRLLEGDAKEFRRKENARIRDMAKTLSTVRDATALIETVDYLADGNLTSEEGEALAFVRAMLTARRDRISSEETDLTQKIADAVDTCHAATDALDTLDLPDSPGKSARRLRKAWAKHTRRSQTALAACVEGGDAEAFHDLRKCGQVYWMHLALLQDAWPSAMHAKHDQTKRLVDALGHEHDLSVLTQAVNESPTLFGDSDKLALLLGTIITHQQAIRTETLEMAQRVFSDDPEREADIIGMLWRDASHQ